MNVCYSLLLKGEHNPLIIGIKLEGPNFICISIKIIREQFFFDGATTYIVQSEIIASFIKLEQMPQGIIFCICIKLIRANRYRW
jgi:hypothetical protein